MSNPDLAMIRYLELAKISQAKRQQAGSDRFLILAGVAACRAGFLDVAGLCRSRVLAHNPHHLLNQWPTLPDAIRSQDFAGFLRQLERFCPTERAEMLLSELGADVALREEDPAQAVALKQLSDAVWEQPGVSINEEPDPGESGKTA